MEGTRRWTELQRLMVPCAQDHEVGATLELGSVILATADSANVGLASECQGRGQIASVEGLDNRWGQVLQGSKGLCVQVRGKGHGASPCRCPKVGTVNAAFLPSLLSGRVSFHVRSIEKRTHDMSCTCFNRGDQASKGSPYGDPRG